MFPQVNLTFYSLIVAVIVFKFYILVFLCVCDQLSVACDDQSACVCYLSHSTAFKTFAYKFSRKSRVILFWIWGLNLTLFLSTLFSYRFHFRNNATKLSHSPVDPNDHIRCSNCHDAYDDQINKNNVSAWKSADNNNHQTCHQQVREWL